MDLLFAMVHWHRLAKLRMHSDLTLEILDQQTTDLGELFRLFKANVCNIYHTQELNREVDARYRRQAKEAAKRSEKDQANATMEGPARKPRAGVNSKGKEKVSPGQSQDASKQSRKTKSFNFGTYKFHALGDYVTSIRFFGTTDSYSTEPVSHFPLLVMSSLNFYKGELEHRMPKGRYRRTDRRRFVRQLTQIERRQARLRRIKQHQQRQASRSEVNETVFDPKLHHHIGQSEKIYDDFGQYLRNHAKDPAIKVIHILLRRTTIILTYKPGLPTSVERPYLGSSPAAGDISA